MALSKAQQAIVRKEALEVGIPADFALGIVDKESAGRGFYKVGKENLPAIRIEGHYVYKLTSGKVRDAAVAAGLAAQRSGVVKNSNTMAGRYTQLNRLIEIVGHEIAYKSISMGIGQVMGTNHRIVGYTSATAMFQAACASFDNQVDQMLAFIASEALKQAQDYDYKGFALIYNGKSAPKSYWVELEQFVQSYANDNGVLPDPILARIKALGYSSVMEFQSAVGIKVDGIAGPITKDKLNAAEASIKKVENKPIVDAGKGAVVAVGAGATTVVANNPDLIEGGIDLVEPITTGLAALAPLGTTVILVVVGAALVFFAWKAYQAHQRKQ